VQHDFTSGQLRLFAVFSMSALEARAVELAIARGLRTRGTLAQLERLDLPATGQQSFLLTVTPSRKGSGAR